MSQSVHIAVMVEEVMQGLDPQPGQVVVDATLGGGTHTQRLLEAVGSKGRVISFDVDREALARAREKFAPFKNRWLGIESNFRHLATQLALQGIDRVDHILADLGYSSDELESQTIGLSFQTDAPLDMRFGEAANDDGLTAADIVNRWPESEIADAIYLFGEERQSRRIARAITEARRRLPIISTIQLANIIREALGKGYERGRIDPATRTFQALRIAVNDELEALKDLLRSAETVLKPNGRIAIISFHSLEDRLVKEAFRSSEVLTALTKKPIEASEEEVKHNPRARSAKLRVATKLGE